MKQYFFSFTLLVLLCACGCENTSTQLFGTAQGTTYTIKYKGENLPNLQTGIDSLLSQIDKSLSFYIPNSTLSKVNTYDTSFSIDPVFAYVFLKSKEIYQNTNGAFNPTVMPLVDAWGFGLSDSQEPDSSSIDSLRKLVDFDLVFLRSIKSGKYNPDSKFDSLTKLPLDSHYLIKTNPKVQLDFNGIAQGFSVDLIADYLEKHDIFNYMVELGGEIRLAGLNPKNKNWIVGIDKPDENSMERELKATISLTGKSLATSGNYRKFYVKDGIKYSHAIDPTTGYPVKHKLLSVTVIADDCISADAYATAFLVMGTKRSKEFLINNSGLNLDVFLIYSGEDGKGMTFATDGIKSVLTEKN